VALHLDVVLGEPPPSVMAVDVATGELLWQLFVSADWIDRYAVSESKLVFRLPLDQRAIGGFSG
jgi:hypothetical protein